MRPPKRSEFAAPWRTITAHSGTNLRCPPHRPVRVTYTEKSLMRGQHSSRVCRGEKDVNTLAPAVLQEIATAIAAASGDSAAGLQAINVAGGDINAAFQLRSGQQVWFLKINSDDRLSMFEAEAAALKEIASTETVCVPRPICVGAAEGHAWLVLEWLELLPLDGAVATRLGHALAALHRHTAPEYGWHRDNTIGATPQSNTWSGSWLTFWKEQRLGYQLQLAADNGYYGKVQILGHKILKECDVLFAGYSPVPSLLHGDLWAGNAACDRVGEPIVYDPASYYGDRETDLAMTDLFGGFPDFFMTAYEEAWPLDRGYRLRRDFYNLYHLLNHLNLFGRGYLGQSEAVMQRLVAALV